VAVLSAHSGHLPRLLPPLARGREWLAAGLGAGLCLGAAETLGLHARGVELPPVRMLSLVAADAATVAALALPLALATALARRRLRHSTVAAGILGPTLLAPALPRALAAVQAGVPAGVDLATGAALAALAGLLAAWAGSRLERAGIPISGPPLWAAVALLVAASGALREGGPLEGSPALWWVSLGAVVLVLALLAAFLAVLGAHRETLVPWPWGRTLLALALAAAAIALAPRLLPWLLMDPPAPARAGRSPDVLVLDLGVFAAGEAPGIREPGTGGAGSLAPNLTLLATAGILYRRVLGPAAEGSAFEWLRLPGGLPVARALRARGYAARVAGESRGREALPPGFERSEARAGDAETEQTLRATVGGALLAIAGAGAARPTGNPPAAARITGQAQGRIAAARSFDPERPLLLLVDYGAAERRASLLDDEVGRLLDFLAELGLDENARIAVTWREAKAPGEGVMRALLRPEPAAPRMPRGEVVETAVLASELAERVAGLSPAAGEVH
jgi:hypothetical protein